MNFIRTVYFAIRLLFAVWHDEQEIEKKERKELCHENIHSEQPVNREF